VKVILSVLCLKLFVNIYIYIYIGFKSKKANPKCVTVYLGFRFKYVRFEQVIFKNAVSIWQS
jgi:hypothetical protein